MYIVLVWIPKKLEIVFYKGNGFEEVICLSRGGQSHVISHLMTSKKGLKIFNHHTSLKDHCMSIPEYPTALTNLLSTMCYSPSSRTILGCMIIHYRLMVHDQPLLVSL